METALQKLNSLWAASEYRKALKLVAGWPRLGEHKDTIQRGWSAVSNPNIYRELGKDPDILYAAAPAAVATRYELSTTPERD